MSTSIQLPRIAFVIPRYLPEMVGGAETLLQGYAEQLHEHGYLVEVLTTCTDQLGAWNNALPPGPDVVRGVPVRRFLTDIGNRRRYWQLAEELSSAGHLEYRKQRALLHESLNSAELISYLQRSIGDYEAVLVGPYAFGLAFAAAQAAQGKAIWVPCLHDEPLAHCTVVREALEEARGILFNAEAEQCFAREQLGLANPHAAVVGCGFPIDAPRGDGARFRAQRQVPGPLLLYAGRIIPEKNVGQLVSLFEQYRQRYHPDTTLALVGERSGIDVERPGVRALGRLPAETLRDAYAAADLFCQPSRNESFSIVIMESWLEQRPVLVHDDCAVTREHVARSQGGWTFSDFESFAAALSAAIDQPQAAAERGRLGYEYVQQHYAWPVVFGRLAGALDQLLAERTLVEQLSQRGIRRALEFTREHYQARLGDLVEEAVPEERRLSIDQLLTPLRHQAAIGLPQHRVESRARLIGPIIAWLRRNLTSHLKEPYVDVIVQQQALFNAELIERLQHALEYSIREQRRMERHIRLLESQLKAAQHRTDSSEPPTS